MSATAFLTESKSPSESDINWQWLVTHAGVCVTQELRTLLAKQRRCWRPKMTKMLLKNNIKSNSRRDFIKLVLLLLWVC